MVYTNVTLDTNVRAMLISVATIPVISDPDMQTIMAQGKRRLDNDQPNELYYTLQPNAQGWHQMTATAPGWVNQFSVVREMQNPVPTPNGPLQPLVYWVDPISYGLLTIVDPTSHDPIEWLRTDVVIQPGNIGQIAYTVPWEIQGLDDGVTTSLTKRYQNALELICAAKAAETMAAEADSHIGPNIPADIINWSDKSKQWRDSAVVWEGEYRRELRLDDKGNMPVIVRYNYQHSLSGGFPYLTHRWGRLFR